MNTPPKVLIIEDEPDIREALADMFQMQSFAVYTATNGQEGLEVAFAEKPDIILLDLNMPIMNGHEALQRLRNDPWGKTVKVVVLSALDDVSNIASAHTGDITQYIVKAHASLGEIVKRVRESLYIKE